MRLVWAEETLRLRGRSYGRGRCQGWLMGYGEANYKDSASFGQVMAGDSALVFLDDSISNAQAQAHPFANRLSSIEGIKYAVLIEDPGPGVGKFQN